MKNLIIALGLLTIFTCRAFACRNQVPRSEAQRYIDACPSGVPALYTCADKPDEPCLCFDQVDDWCTSKIGAGDSGEDVIVSDPDKVAAKVARLQADAASAAQKANKKSQAMDAVKNFDKAKLNNNAKILDFLESVVELLKE
jgi:hypothetical protein